VFICGFTPDFLFRQSGVLKHFGFRFKLKMERLATPRVNDQ